MHPSMMFVLGSLAVAAYLWAGHRVASWHIREESACPGAYASPDSLRDQRVFGWLAAGWLPFCLYVIVDAAVCQLGRASLDRGLSPGIGRPRVAAIAPEEGGARCSA